MEKRDFGEDAIEIARGQLQRKKVLLPDLAAAVLARHAGELRRTFKSDRLVAKSTKRHSVTARAAPKIEDPQRPCIAHVAQKRLNVAFNIMVARTIPKVSGVFVVVLKRLRDNERQIVKRQCDRVP